MIARRDLGAALAVAVMLAAIVLGAWLNSGAGRTGERVQAVVLSALPGVQVRADVDAIQAVLSLRLDDGRIVTIKRPVECIGGIRPGSRVALRGVTSWPGGVRWHLDQGPCRFTP